MVQEKSEQIFFAQPQVHQNKFVDLNKTVPTDPLKMIAFFEQYQATNKADGVLEKIAKDKQPKEKKTAHFPVVRSCESSYHQHCSCKYMTTIEATNATATIVDPTIIIKMIDTTIALDATARNQRAPSPMTRRMIASAITSRKRATRPCIMTSPLCQALAICLEDGVDLVPDLLCVLALGLALAQAAGATTTIMSTKMIASQVQPPSVGICTLRTTMMDITIAQTKGIPCLPPSLLQRQRRSAPRNRELHQ